MKNFKPGQKVVYKEMLNPQGHIHLMIMPKENEVVTIAGKCSVYPDHWDIVEYTKGKGGVPQSICDQSLFPLEENEQTVTLAVKKIKLEPKEVLIKTEELLTAN